MKKILVILTVIIITIVIYFVYTQVFYLNIIVKFDDLEPIENQLRVYYKGFKIGKTIKIYPDKNYKNTYLKIRIKPRSINLPANVCAKIKHRPTINYLSIESPNKPSIKKLKNNSIIKGIPDKDIKNIINESFEQEDIYIIINEATNLMESTSTTIKEMEKAFKIINELLISTNKNIQRTMHNTETTSHHLSKLSEKIDNSINTEKSKISFENITETTENMKDITKNISKITEIIEKETIPNVNEILYDTDKTIKNTEEITLGIKQTLRKRMGVMKIMFGKPIEKSYD